PRAPLAGRRTELALIAAALERVGETRSPALVTVAGPPGLRKSRPPAGLRPPGARAPAGRPPPPRAGGGFLAAGGVVTGLAGVPESDSSADASARLAALVADTVSDAADAEWVLRHAAGLVGAGAGQAESAGERRAEEFAAWRALLEALAEERALLLAFEDIH